MYRQSVNLSPFPFHGFYFWPIELVVSSPSSSLYTVSTTPQLYSYTQSVLKPFSSRNGTTTAKTFTYIKSRTRNLDNQDQRHPYRYAKGIEDFWGTHPFYLT